MEIVITKNGKIFPKIRKIFPLIFHNIVILKVFLSISYNSTNREAKRGKVLTDRARREKGQ
jgi:hypothetical protein